MKKARDEVIYEKNNLRFTCEAMRAGEPAPFVVQVHRISDGLRLQKGQFFVKREPTDEELAELAEVWVYSQAGADEPEKSYCSSCKTELKPEFGMDTNYQFEGALHITFSGGYGMFIDPMFEDDPKAIICHECAHALCEQHSWISQLLRPEQSA